MNRTMCGSMLAVAVSGAVLAWLLSEAQRKGRAPRDHAAGLHDWEGEGGNLAPAPATSHVPPGATQA